MQGDLTALIARVERATGPNLATEISIAILLDTAPEGFLYVEETQGWQRYIPARDSVEFWMPPAYTASLDATLALVDRKLPGIYWHIARGKTRPSEPMFGAELVTTAGNQIVAVEHDHSAPLALILALLRALQSQLADRSPSPTEGDADA